MGTHARLSASSSERWMQCPGSVALSERLPEQESSEFAAEGSAAHAVAEKCLREGIDAWTMIGQVMEGHERFPVTPEMAEHLQVYTDYVRKMAGDNPIHVETRIENAELGANFGGTCDAYVLGQYPVLLSVFDLKYGQGIAVAAEGNSQMMYYAFGLLKTLGITKGDVCLTIVQPRDPLGDPIKEVWTTAEAILHWADNELLPAMWAVDKPEAPLIMGEHCRWCPAKLICPRMRENFMQVVERSDVLVEVYSEQQLASEYSCIPAAEMYIRALKDEALKRAMAGRPVEGTKLVAGRADRTWKAGAEEQITARFGEEAYLKSLRSPAQIERLVGGKDFAAEWAFKPEGRPTLASADDKRSELSPGAAFKNVGA